MADYRGIHSRNLWITANLDRKNLWITATILFIAVIFSYLFTGFILRRCCKFSRFYFTQKNRLHNHVHSAIVLSNDREMWQEENILYMPVYFTIFLDSQGESGMVEF